MQCPAGLSAGPPAPPVPAALALERRHGRTHRVLGIREALQVTLGEVRRALGVPGPGPDTAELFRNKARMHTAAAPQDLIYTEGLLAQFNQSRTNE